MISVTLTNISFKEQSPKKSKNDTAEEKSRENFKQILDEATSVYLENGSSTESNENNKEKLSLGEI